MLAAEADVARVKALTGYLKIRAPYDGIITTRNVHQGHLVLPGTEANAKPLLVVVQSATGGFHKRAACSQEPVDLQLIDPFADKVAVSMRPGGRMRLAMRFAMSRRSAS